MEHVKSRVRQFDTIRGIAIVIMIWANSFPYLANFNPLPIFRVLMSLAAPLFIFLSGITSFYRTSNKSNAFIAYMAVLLMAVIIDFGIWGIIPFSTFDVLYLIAFAGVFLLLFNNNFILHFSLFFGLIFIYIFAYELIDYRFIIPEVPINSNSEFSFSNSIKRFIIDGWFPILPWISFVFLGRAYAIKQQYFNQFLSSNKKVIAILFLFTVFFVTYYCQFNELRLGYIEIFYPVKIYFIFLAIVWILLQLALSTSIKSVLLSEIGKYSLTIYFVHAIITKFIFNNLLQKYSVWGYSILSILQLIFVFIFAIILNKFLKTRIYAKTPYFIKKLFGI